MTYDSILEPPPKPRLRGVSHLVAAIVAIPATALLVLHAASGAGLVAFLYGLSLVSLLGVSALYHTPNWSPGIRMWLRRADHSMIYLLIAGTYTPFCLAMGEQGVHLLLPMVWGAGVGGIIKSVLWPTAPKWVSALLFAALGWAVAPWIPNLYAALGPLSFGLLAVGGVVYSAGALTYALRWPNPNPEWFGYHEIFHVMVIFAAACHYAAVWETVG